MTAQPEKLPEAWIRRYEIIEKLGAEAEQAKALFWAYEEVDRICSDSPEQCLKLINNILESTDNDYVLANLAAGPLESVLARHGKAVIAEVEANAKKSQRFRSLLQNVWQNRMDDETWGKVLKAAKA